MNRADEIGSQQAYPHGNPTDGGELGMTIRQAYKIAAMQGMSLEHAGSFRPGIDDKILEWIAKAAGMYADAMLSEDSSHEAAMSGKDGNE